MYIVVLTTSEDAILLNLSLLNVNLQIKIMKW